MQFIRKLKSLDAKEKEDNFESHKTHLKKFQYNIVVLHYNISIRVKNSPYRISDNNLERNYK